MDNNQQLEKRIADLERKLSIYERAFTITPTKIVINQSILLQGLFHADRVYTKRSSNYVELTT